MASKLASFYLDLHQDWTWVSRRVETVEMVDLENRQRRVSIDIHVSAVVERARAAGLEEYPELPVPLGLITKGLLLDYDVRDESDASVSVFTSSQDARLGRLALLELARRDFPLPNDHDVVRDIEHLFLDAAELTPTFKSMSDYLKLGERIEPSFLPHAHNDAQAYWSAIAQHPELLRLLSTLTASFAPVVWFPLSGQLEIVKYRRVENEPDALFGPNSEENAAVWRDRFLRPTLPYTLRAANIGYASREHLRLTAPEGTFFGASTIVPAVPSGVSKVEYRERWTADRTLFFSTGQKPGNYYVLGALYPQEHGFFTPAILLAASATILVLVGGVSELMPFHFLEMVQHDIEAAVALMLLIPSIFIAFIIRDNEHAARRRLLRRFRTLTLTLTVVPVVTAAVSLFANFNDLWWLFGVIWVFLGLFPGALIVGLIVERNALKTMMSAVEERSTMDVDKVVEWRRVQA
ncbi:hypothetical protein [Mesorhizobium japonicum]|uniref:hypothetical protein n=1 Tax=Mesorhizobium japonicum TaxID=2066070 RepID=UPI003B5AE9B0